MKLNFTKIANDLPVTVPFVGPESQERENSFSFNSRLGANESVFGPSKMVVNAITAQAKEVWKYGDPESFDLLNKLSEFYNLPRENFIVGEGIDGLLGNLVRLFIGPGDEVVSSLGAYPTFKYHVDGFGGKISLVPYNNYYEDLDALLISVKKSKAKILYLSNPDNPMGTFHSKDNIQDFMANIPDDTILCLDEAYSDFVHKDELASINVEHENVIRFRTFSKAYGLAGLRVGYGIGNKKLVEAFNKVRNHFGVNKLAQIAAKAALEDQDHLKTVLKKVDQSKKDIAALFQRFGFTSLSSRTNFVPINSGGDDKFAAKLMSSLIQEKIFVRMPSVSPLNSFIRITAGTNDDLMILDNAMHKIIKEI
ncbi:aminotransferase class I/II-fold pyridoxal phosphate-dependent enzyme [Paracoccaceae bacterium]|nr:aminotransferase class I/II-fold pyridoxal phosphate-dependent enzyme [Paracoccaceae bacterium]